VSYGSWHSLRGRIDESRSSRPSLPPPWPENQRLHFAQLRGRGLQIEFARTTVRTVVLPQTIDIGSDTSMLERFEVPPNVVHVTGYVMSCWR